MTEDQIASIQYAADWLSRSEDIGNRKHGERLRALLSASIADTAAVPTDLLPQALWTRRGSGTDEWWSYKGYQARKDAADQWVLRKGGEELYRHTYLQVVMAHAERALLAAPPAPSVADAAGANEEDVRDAARYRKVRMNAYLFGINNPTPEQLDSLADYDIAANRAAIAKESGK